MKEKRILHDIFQRAGTAKELEASLRDFTKRYFGEDSLFPVWTYGDQCLKVLFRATCGDKVPSKDIEVLFGTGPGEVWEIKSVTGPEKTLGQKQDFPTPWDFILWMVSNITRWFTIPFPDSSLLIIEKDDYGWDRCVGFKLKEALKQDGRKHQEKGRGRGL